jgi:hypothetical protein
LTRRGIGLFPKRKLWYMDSKLSEKAYHGSMRGLSKTSSAMTLRAGWISSTS